MKKLYELALANASSPPPKRGFFSSKCRTCGAKLKKEKVVHQFYAGEEAEDSANKVVNNHGESPGF